jgi:hypothetical protein
VVHCRCRNTGLIDRELGRTKSHGSHDHDKKNTNNTLTQLEFWPVEARHINVQQCMNYVRKYGIQNLKEKKSDLHSKQMFSLLTQSTGQVHTELHWYQDTKQPVQSYWQGYPHANSYKIMHTKE